MMKNVFKTTYLIQIFFLGLTSFPAGAQEQNSFHFEFRDGFYRIYEDSYPKELREAMGINYKYYQNHTYINGKTLAQFLIEEQDKNPDALYLYGGWAHDTEDRLWKERCIPTFETMFKIINERLKQTDGVENCSVKVYSHVYSLDGILRLLGFSLWDNEDKTVTKQLLTEDQFRAIFNEAREKVRIETWDEKILYLYGKGIVYMLHK